MIRYGFLCFFLTICLFDFHPTFAQKKLDRQIKRLEADAGQLYDSKLWNEALDGYLLLDSIIPGNPEYKFRIGVIYYHSIDKAKSLDYFLDARKGGKADPNLDFYLARAYHFNLEFDSAVYYYRKSIEVPDSVQTLGKNLEFEIEKHIQDCQLAARYVEDPLLTPINNVGEPVNSPFPEYVPLVSSDENMMIFTSRRPNTTGRRTDQQGMFMEDIYISRRDASGNWSEPDNDLKFNTPDHDACVGLSADGKTLILYRSENGGDLYLSEYNGQNWSDPVPFGEINTTHWESSACFSEDRQYVYFVSDKPGGFGGSDIYRARLQPNGKYGEIENLGQVINTRFDEDAPQIHSDGKTLFFSSRGHEGLGGFDIYSSVYVEANSQWGTPRNIGYPINTPDDDIYFTLLSNGTKGYFSSYRSDTHGEKDIYMISRPESVATKFLMKFNLYDPYFNKPLQARITITNQETGDKKTIIASDSTLGKYNIPLDFKTDYLLGIEATGYQFKEKVLNMDYRADIFEYVMNVAPKKEEVIALVDSISFARIMRNRNERLNSMKRSLGNADNDQNILSVKTLGETSGMVPGSFAEVVEGIGEIEQQDTPGGDQQKMNTTGRMAEYNNRKEYNDPEPPGNNTIVEAGSMQTDPAATEDNGTSSLTSQDQTVSDDDPANRNDDSRSDNLIAEPVRREQILNSLDLEEDDAWVKEMINNEPEVIYLKRIDSREKVVVPVINFDFNSFRIKEKDLMSLKDLAAFLQHNPDIVTLVAGHTDSIGRTSYNQELSEFRAQVVRQVLVRNGVPEIHVLTIGYGEKFPLLANNSVTGRRINRRASLMFIDIHDPKYTRNPYRNIIQAFNLKLDPEDGYMNPIIIWEKLPVSIHFTSNEYETLTQYSARKLDQLAVYFQNKPYELVICGFEDESETQNSGLGIRRSRRAFEYLSSKGISPDRMIILDKDNLQNFYDIRDLPGGVEQRRVQFFVVKN